MLLTCVRVAEFDGIDVAGFSVPEVDVPEGGRNLNRLDKVLGSIEQYIHIAFAWVQKDDVISKGLLHGALLQSLRGARLTS
jgi:hypothetical protein